MTGPEQDTQALANTVRDEIPQGHYGTCRLGVAGRQPCDCGADRRGAAVAALDALVAHIEELQQQLNAVIEASSIAETGRLNAEAERDTLKDALRDLEEIARYWERHDKTDPDVHERWRLAAIARAKMVGDKARAALDGLGKDTAA